MVVTAYDALVAHPGYAQTMDLLIALEQAWSSTLGLLQTIPAESWDSSSACTGWTVHDVAAHLGHVEGITNGFEQPDAPEDFDGDQWNGLDLITNMGVAARRSWSNDKVLNEVDRAAAATVGRLRTLDTAGWQQPMASPVGMLPTQQAIELRLADLYVHLLDIRFGLGQPLTADDEPAAAAAVIHRAVRLTGWGAVKGAGLPDGTRIRLDLRGAGGVTGDLVVTGSRGTVELPGDTPDDRVAGSGLAYLLAVAGREGPAEAAGGLEIVGEPARKLIAGYRLFG